MLFPRIEVQIQVQAIFVSKEIQHRATFYLFKKTYYALNIIVLNT